MTAEGATFPGQDAPDTAAQSMTVRELISALTRLADTGAVDQEVWADDNGEALRVTGVEPSDGLEFVWLLTKAEH